MNSSAPKPDGKDPPAPKPTSEPPPIEEPDPDELPDEKRTPNPDEVRTPPVHAGWMPMSTLRFPIDVLAKRRPSSFASGGNRFGPTGYEGRE